jgi:hypothetical protein
MNTPTKLIATVAVTGALALAACSSSGGTKPATSPSSPAPTTSSSPAPVSSSPVASSPAAPTPADAATTAAVTKAYTTFFGGTKNPAALVADLQNGDKLSAALATEAKNPTAPYLTAKVSKVVLENPHVADVTWTLLEKGSALLTNTSGKAVLVGGTWKLAAETFCGLVLASGAQAPQCSDTSITGLPTS